MPFGFKTAVFPRSIILCALPGIFAHENRGIHVTIITVRFRHPDGLAPCVANAVILHGHPRAIRLEAVKVLWAAATLDFSCTCIGALRRLVTLIFIEDVQSWGSNP